MKIINYLSSSQVLLLIVFLCSIAVIAICKHYNINLCGFKFTRPKKKDKSTQNINKSNIDRGIVGGTNNTIINNGINEKRVREIIEEEQAEALTKEEIENICK